MPEIKVLIVDDSLLFREVLTKGLSQYADMQIIGAAADPFEAKDKIIELRPDVVALDVEMPRMDGIKFLRNLMPQFPIPVVVISSLRESVFEAMDAGAIDFVAKPVDVNGDPSGFIREIAEKIRVAYSARALFRKKMPADIDLKMDGLTVPANPLDIIAIGASTGGTEAIVSILTKYQANVPGTVIVQHMPEGFTELFAQRLDAMTQLAVKEAEDGDEVRPGRALIAPGGRQMRIRKSAGGYAVCIDDSEKVNGHKPSVDVLFESVAEEAGRRAIGVILTGMGSDGAKGLKRIKDSGGYTIGQDERSSIVYGMPMAAHLTGAVTIQLPLYRIPDEIIRKLNSQLGA
jgi:two-component system chemotaxis response regulator CheB